MPRGLSVGEEAVFAIERGEKGPCAVCGHIVAVRWLSEGSRATIRVAPEPFEKTSEPIYVEVMLRQLTPVGYYLPGEMPVIPAPALQAADSETYASAQEVAIAVVKSKASAKAAAAAVPSEAGRIKALEDQLSAMMVQQRELLEALQSRTKKSKKKGGGLLASGPSIPATSVLPPSNPGLALLSGAYSSAQPAAISPVTPSLGASWQQVAAGTDEASEEASSSEEEGVPTSPPLGSVQTGAPVGKKSPPPPPGLSMAGNPAPHLADAAFGRALWGTQPLGGSAPLLPSAGAFPGPSVLPTTNIGLPGTTMGTNLNQLGMPAGSMDPNAQVIGAGWSSGQRNAILMSALQTDDHQTANVILQIETVRAMKKLRKGDDSSETSGDEDRANISALPAMAMYGGSTQIARKMKGVREMRKEFYQHPERVVVAFVNLVNRGSISPMGAHGTCARTGAC